MSKVCKTCGATFSQPKNVGSEQWSKRKFCSRACITSATKHGESWRTSEYWIWQAMIQRCVNPTSKNYYKYGARGISVCEQWRSSFVCFLSDMGRRPPSHSLDRIDNDGHYCKENCRWATLKVQANNTRWNKVLTIRDQTKTVAQWADEFGIKANTITFRLRRGWSPERAVTEPIDTRHRNSRASL